MSNYENGRFIIESDAHEKTISLTNNYTNQIVVKLSPVNKNINVYLSDVQNNYFVAAKSSSEQVEVNYVVIESES
tara:strand:- start:2945 stop:3169 length:225 start_codon:yes stop_codon:yes gene_type:complete